MSPRIFLISAASLLLVLGARPAESQYSVSAYAACSTTDSVYVIWTLLDSSGDPGAHPEFVGFDLLRRPLPGCGEYVVANEQIIPREPGVFQTVYYQEQNPSIGQVHEYRVIAVDASRQQLFFPGFCGPCDVYQECPPLSAPVTVGTIVDEGFWLRVIPCPGSCYPAPYLEGAIADELRPYAGTATAFQFFGRVACGGVEGCSIQVDHYDLATCTTAAAPSSWGRLKTIYR